MARSVFGLRITDRTRQAFLTGLAHAAFAVMAAGFLALASVSGAGAEGPAASVSLTPRAPAQVGEPQEQVSSGDVATFLGLVQRTPEGRLATRVRAVGMLRGEAVNCGTSSVTPLDSGLGFYRVTVFSSATRAGCPSGGQAVQFRLLYGAIDDGIPATAQQDLTMRPGDTIVAVLVPDAHASTRALWSGPAPVSIAPGVTETALTWLGADHTPIAEALATLDASAGMSGASSASVTRAWRWDAAAGRTLVYFPDGPSFLQTLTTLRHGDLVRLRFE